MCKIALRKRNLEFVECAVVHFNIIYVSIINKEVLSRKCFLCKGIPFFIQSTVLFTNMALIPRYWIPRFVSLYLYRYIKEVATESFPAMSNHFYDTFYLININRYFQPLLEPGLYMYKMNILDSSTCIFHFKSTFCLKNNELFET